MDTTVDYKDFIADPWVTKSEYFGKVKWGDFTIYQVGRGLLNRTAFLKIKGRINDDELTLKITYHPFLIMIFNYLGLVVFSLILIGENIYFGVGLLLIILIQLFFLIRSYGKKKNSFIAKIEQMIGD